MADEQAVDIGLAVKFDEAVNIVNELPKDGPVKPSNDDKLEFYGLYKQATIGDVNTNPLGMFSFDLVGTAKWNAWNKHKGQMSSEEAKAKYVWKLREMVKGKEAKEAKAIWVKLQIETASGVGQDGERMEE